MNKSIKSTAKSLGVKSTFVNDKTVVMTSFGKGNKANIAKRIQKSFVETKERPVETFSVKVIEKSLHVTGKRTLQGKENPETSLPNPIYSERALGEDLVGNKSVLERRYFGKEFPKDNLHIQVIYNILDIEKILAVYSSNISFALDNISSRENNGKLEDLLGDVISGLRKKYENFITPGTDEKNKERKEIFEHLYQSKRLAYFGDAFYSIKGEDGVKRSAKDVYYLLAVLSEVRQFTVHDDKEEGATEGRTSVYRVEKWASPEARSVLDTLYREKIQNICDSAISNSERNLSILFDVLNIQDPISKRGLSKQYFKFAILKEYKNKGFSLRKLREYFLEEYKPGLRENKRWDTLRSKLYTLLDFVLYRNFDKRASLVEEIIAALRMTRTEEEKEDVYQKYAKVLAGDVKFCTPINDFFFRMEAIADDPNSIKNISLSQTDKQLVSQAIKDASLSEKASGFCELIYAMTLFLDGKEINDLLTNLVHKLENIGSFIEVMHQEQMPCKFTENYDFFNAFDEMQKKSKATQVAEELRKINSFARMSKHLPEARRPLFVDSAYLLGLDLPEEQIIQYLDDKMLSKEREKLPNGKLDNGFRNFIANNMLESWRFRYIVRFVNPKSARNLMMNKALVQLVFKDIPDTMIERYYQSCTADKSDGQKAKSISDKRDYLVNQIMSCTVETFEHVQQKADATVNAEKQRLITLMSLYLNSIYQLVKNLVNINARYIMAFHCLERDNHLKGKEKDDKLILAEESIKEKRVTFDKYVAKLSGPINYYKQMGHRLRVLEYCEKDFASADKILLYSFRNDVAHLNIVRHASDYTGELTQIDSYYALYQYCAQRRLKDTFAYGVEKKRIVEENGVYYQERFDRKTKEKIREAFNPATVAYLDQPEKYHSYSKDFTKALCVPFMYNLARFKNLTIEGLFDKNRPGQGKKEDK